MELLKVVWTQTAVKQRNHVFDYWNERNQTNTFSTKLNKEIKATIKLLQTFPLLGKATSYPKTRTLLLRKNYSLLYQVTKSQIIVVGFWDNRQSPQKLLDFLSDV